MRPWTLVAAALAVAAPAVAAPAIAAPATPAGPAVAPPATPPTADQIVARMQKFYESTRDLHARFDQELQTGAGRKRKATGEMWLKKPGRMRWEYQKPEKKLMVADGQSLWIYEPDDEQAFKQDLKGSALPSSVTFLFGAGRLTEEFDVSLAPEEKGASAAPGTVAVKLVPKKPTAQYRYLVFHIDEKTSMVTGTAIYDQQGGTNRMSFRDVEVNRGVGDDRFRFSPPVGTRILRP